MKKVSKLTASTDSKHQLSSQAIVRHLIQLAGPLYPLCKIFPFTFLHAVQNSSPSLSMSLPSQLSFAPPNGVLAFTLPYDLTVNCLFSVGGFDFVGLFQVICKISRAEAVGFCDEAREGCGCRGR